MHPWNSRAQRKKEAQEKRRAFEEKKKSNILCGLID
jgi:hypothetical protein